MDILFKNATRAKGIMAENISIITDIIVKNINPEKMWLFGSRASGQARPNSDYDIAFEGSDADFRTLRKTKEEVSHALGIYSCDVVDLSEAGHDFKNLVYEKGKLIYERN